LVLHFSLFFSSGLAVRWNTLLNVNPYIRFPYVPHILPNSLLGRTGLTYCSSSSGLGPQIHSNALVCF
jgi:hypothetical protein